MRTWSIASCIDRVTIAIVDAQAFAAVAVQGLIDAAHTVEQMTRPVRRDVRDGAEELADKEAEEECSEPSCRLLAGLDCDCPSCRDMQSKIPPLEDDQVAMRLGLVPDKRPGMHNHADHLCIYSIDDVDPLAICGVCRPVRDIVEEMIEERFPQVSPAVSADARVSAAESGSTPPSSPSVACTDPSSTRSDGLAPVVGGEGAAADSGIPGPPAAARPPWSDLADAMVEHRPSAKVEYSSDREAIEAAICVVLATHAPNQVDSGYVDCCFNSDYFRTRVFRDWQAWRWHVAPLIAEALEPHRIYVKRGPAGEPVPVELRPDEDYRPLYGEKRCATCGYWRSQHVAEDYPHDSNLCCPLWDSATTFTPLDRKHLK